MVLLHGPRRSRGRRRPATSAQLDGVWRDYGSIEAMNRQHIGATSTTSSRERAFSVYAEATAAKRVIAFEIAREMRRIRSPSPRRRIA